MMLHELRLNSQPFNSIKAGTKTVEMRLYDQKRKQIKVGDYIIFKQRDNEANWIKVIVEDIKVFDNFEQLYKAFDKVSIGYKPDEKADPKDMVEYYSVEEQALFGVCAICVKLV